jgi:hypothetical protein
MAFPREFLAGGRKKVDNPGTMNAPPLSLLSDGEGFAISMIVTMLLSITFIGMPIFCIIRNLRRHQPEELADEDTRER